ncbi:MAG: hypothetical protein FD143_1037 [Ignavibacteria bacterium]|nr:MAG: hypothetical protein FD143_1037 [Ignavibacteria bacterium]KAF0160968.1 MAG: hypothetical protein FD188_1189 [Ignavibacteria bacterium]
MVYRNRNTVHLFLVFVVLAAAALIASNYIYTFVRISSYSVVLPKEKWLITIGGNGQVISNLIDYSAGQTVQYNITQFERGEFVALNFAKLLTTKREFEKGDTVLTMHSSDVKNQMVEAINQLEVANAKLKSFSSAEKEPVIKEALTRIAYIDKKMSEQKVLVERSQKLLDKGYTSQQEFDLLKWNLDLLKIEKEIYSSQLENLKTGVKPEELNYLQSEINSIKDRMIFLKEREAQLVITSPVNGQVVTSLSPDTLLKVVNSKEIVLQLPIKAAHYKDFKAGQKIMLSSDGEEKNFSGEVVWIDREVKILNQQQVVLVSVVVDNTMVNMLPGMIPQVTIKLTEISLFQQLVRFFVQ